MAFPDVIADIFAITGGTDPFGGRNQDAIDITYTNIVAKYVTDREPSAVSTVHFEAIANPLTTGYTIDVDSPDGSVEVYETSTSSTLGRSLRFMRTGTWEIGVAAEVNTTLSPTSWGVRVTPLHGTFSSPLDLNENFNLPADPTTYSTTLVYDVDDPDLGAFVGQGLRAVSLGGLSVNIDLTLQCVDPTVLDLAGYGVQTREQLMLNKLAALTSTGLNLDANPFIP